MDKQKTIAKEVSLKGIGLHSGEKVNLTFKPAAVNSGVQFVRTDLPDKPAIKVGVEHLCSKSGSLRFSYLDKDGIQVYTIEHILAALYGMGIDNLNIEIDSKEIPGLDGSSLGFLEVLNKAGIIEQEEERRYWYIKEPVSVEDDGATIVALPAQELKITYTLDYNHPFLNSDFLRIIINPDTFKTELASARTFCLEEEVEELRKQGLGKGGNYENALVVGEKGVINNKLRYEDEFIRHKILDLLGDLYILGRPLKAHIIALKSGHSLNLKLVKKIVMQKQKFYATGIKSAGYLPETGDELNVTEIMQILPHRYPFLFVDKIIHLEEGKRAVGIKNVTINDYFFEGHFPGKPVMPGVLILEAMAQVGGVMMLSLEENRGKIAYFMSINEAKFRKPVSPGEQLVFELVAVKIKSKIGQLHGTATVDGKIVAEADLMFALGDS